tara:strand:- start:173 stop:502 length:330 start_codon:yes stop_codon:yes gene_type:complete
MKAWKLLEWAEETLRSSLWHLRDEDLTVGSVHYNALLPGGEYKGVYVYVQLYSVYLAAHFSRKGKLVQLDIRSFDPESVSPQTGGPIIDIYQFPKKEVEYYLSTKKEVG